MNDTNSINEFLAAFADAAGIHRNDADAQWAGFSRDLPDGGRERIEAGGAESGREMGADFRALYA